MRLLHFADLHLGVESYGRLDPATGLSSRVADFLQALDEVVDFALAEGVDLVLFCGDAYKSRDPSQTQQRDFARRVARLASAGVAVFLLVGNHDLPQAMHRATTVDIFPALEVRNVFIGATFKTHLIPTRSGPVQVVSLPWPRRSALLGAPENRRLSLEELRQLQEDIIARRLARGAEALDPGTPAVLAAHIGTLNARLGSERGMLLGQDPLLPPSVLAQPGFDYGALGHIHRPQELGTDPPLAYSGSLQRIDFGDEADPAKGFYLAELDPARPPGQRLASLRFQPVSTRPFLTISVQPKEEDPTPEVLQALAGHPVAGAIVRLLVSLTPEQSRNAGLEKAVREALREAFHVAALRKEVARPRAERLRLLAGDAPEEQSPLELLERYFTGKKVSAERLGRLMEYGRRLLAEGEEGEG